MRPDIQPGYQSDFPKFTYVGAPVKAIAHPCPVCKKKGPCGCKGKCAPAPMGICTAVVDDANNRVYLYGNIIHENYHVPGNQCIAYTAVESAGFSRDGRLGADEWFDGVQDNNNIGLAHTPIVDTHFMVFLNGVKQREGNEYDYTVNENVVHFNFYQLLPTDRVEVIYEYGAE